MFVLRAVLTVSSQDFISGGRTVDSAVKSAVEVRRCDFRIRLDRCPESASWLERSNPKSTFKVDNMRSESGSKDSQAGIWRRRELSAISER